METIDSEILAPDIIRRVCGGYLAVTKTMAPIRIGATGNTRDEAVAAYNQLIEQWWNARQAEKLSASVSDADGDSL